MNKFRIPQEVQIEDRIFGPITMRRLIILTVGGGITYIIYMWLKDLSSFFWGPIIGILTVLVLALTFLEPFGMRFEKFITRTIEFFTLERVAIWDKRFSQDVFTQYIEDSHRKWTHKESRKEPLQDLIQEKERQKQKVSDLSSLLENDLSQIDLSRYNKTI